MQRIIMVKKDRPVMNGGSFTDILGELKRRGLRINELDFFSVHYAKEEEKTLDSLLKNSNIIDAANFPFIGGYIRQLMEKIRDYINKNSVWSGADQILTIMSIDDNINNKGQEAI